MINKRYVSDDQENESQKDEIYKKALKTSLNILTRKDNTEKALRQKLFARGYDSETIDRVIEYLRVKGYMNEQRMLYNVVEYMANVKLYGKMRIFAELREKGYPSDLLRDLDYSSEELSEIDFRANCVKLYIKKGAKPDKKTYDFLMRYGHSSNDIRYAVKYNEELKIPKYR